MYFSIGNLHKRNEQQRNLSQTTGAVVLSSKIGASVLVYISFTCSSNFLFIIYGFCFMFVYKLTKKWKMTY